MQAVVLDGRGGVDITDLPAPTAEADEVIIAPAAVGICGTDIHLASGDYPTGTFPVVPGHEFAGTVTAVGDAVTRFALGDRVCADPNISCGRCVECRRGATNLCTDLVPIGVTTNGACAQLVTAPERVVYQLPDGVDWATGALIEPLACVLHGLEQVGDVAGQRLLIYGAGSIGLLAVTLARARGATHIGVIEPSPVRRTAAEELGVDSVGAPGQGTGRRDVDLVIEASGHPAAVADAIERLANRGTLLQMGVVSPSERIDFQPYALFDREISLIGSQSLATAYPAAIEAVASLAGLADRIVTHRFALSDYPRALDAARSEDARKVHLLPQQ